jgi:hypothetical protein
MNGRSLPPFPTPDVLQSLRDGYEQLRHHAVARQGGLDRGWGLVMLLRQGMTSWMRAYSESCLSVGPPSQRRAPIEAMVPVTLHQGATRILVAMALSQLGRS